MRTRIFDALSPMTPNAPDWETYRAWTLIAHLGANKAGTPLRSLSQEVHATREVRETLGDGDGNSMVEDAKEAAEILHSNDLYATALSDSNRLRAKSAGEYLKGLLGLLLMLATLPIAIPSSGLQWGIAKSMAEDSDEGLDSRTSYFMLAAMFSPIFFWPPCALIGTLILTGGAVEITTLWTFILLILIFYFSASICIKGYDLWSDSNSASRRAQLLNSEDGERVHQLVDSITSRLGALK
jgi:hypothetical protein